MFTVMNMSASATVWLADVSLIVPETHCSYMTQRNKIYQALDTQINK